MGDEIVLELEEKLSQCRQERDRLRTEKQSLMIKEREIERLIEELKVEVEAISRATSEFEQQKKTLESEWLAKRESVIQVGNASDEFHVYYFRQFSHEYERLVNANAKYDELYAETKKRREFCEAGSEKLDKLQSVIDLKWKILIAFLENSQENSKITDDMKPFLQAHYDAYVKTLKTGDDDYRMLKKYVHFFLQPSSVQKESAMFGKIDLTSPVSAAISKASNFFIGINGKLGERGNNVSENIKGGL